VFQSVDFRFDLSSRAPMCNIALFGTSADPPTAGHQAIIAWLADHCDRVAVWAADNPFKGHQTPLPHRTAMLRLLIDDLDPPRPNVQLHPELSQLRTIHTLELARQQWPEAQFTLVIGSDLVPQLPRWYRAEELFHLANLLVVPRPGYPLEEADLSDLRQRGAQVAIADLTGPDTSSSAYREHGHTPSITPPVEDYIHREHLYSCRDAPRAKQTVH